MPELPDLTIVSEAFHAALAGRSVTRAAAPAPLAVRGTPAELQALVGQRLARIAQRGKFLLLDFDPDRVVVNPMLTGRFQLARPGAPLPSKTAFVLAFGPRDSAPSATAEWTRGAAWMPANSEAAEVRYRDPTQMGKVYLLPAGAERPVVRLVHLWSCPKTFAAREKPPASGPWKLSEASRKRPVEPSRELKGAEVLSLSSSASVSARCCNRRTHLRGSPASRIPSWLRRV